MCDDSSRRKCLLNELACLVDKMDCCDPCCPQMCCPPMIEMYDPCPKPAIPLACPAPITPLDPDIPVPHVASPANPCGGVCIPIVSPQPVPCIPLANPCPTDQQPCVPCNPPQMMVCYRRSPCKPVGRRSLMPPRGGGGGGGGGGCCGSPCGGGGCCFPVKTCKSRELRSSILYIGCDCERRNGLQDQCPRTGCIGNPMCMCDPPACCPSQYAQGKHFAYLGDYMNRDRGNGGGYGGNSGTYSMNSDGSMRATYLCYPAYFKMPPCSPGCCPPCGPTGAVPCIPDPPPSCGPCPPCNACCKMPQCVPPVPTIPLPPCPPVCVPAPPQVIPNPVPVPVPTPIFPSCPTVPPCC